MIRRSSEAGISLEASALGVVQLRTVKTYSRYTALHSYFIVVEYRLGSTWAVFAEC
jgi:hypothetical protein